MSGQLGILGVGHLASYVVAGLRNAGDQRKILLSPRNRERALLLEREHGCTIAADNQTIADRCNIILLAVRPAQAEELLKSLTFKADQLLISCVAGMPLTRLLELTGNAQVVRTLPLACAEFGEGVVPLYPDHPAANSLLDRIGKLIVFNTENDFELASTAACMNGWVYALLDRLTGWFIEQGLDETQARELVTHSVRGATGLAAARPELPLRAICDSIATEGTFTKMGLDLLDEKDALSIWSEVCKKINDALNS